MTQININELERYIVVCQLEQSFRAKLWLIKSITEFQLKLQKELKPLAESLYQRKKELRELNIKDKDLHRQIFNAMNKRFKDGII